MCVDMGYCKEIISTLIRRFENINDLHLTIDPFHDDVTRLWGGIRPRLLMLQLESVNRKPIRGMLKIFEKS